MGVVISVRAASVGNGAALAGVVIGVVWLAAIALGGVAACVWLRDRSRAASWPNPWLARAGWTVAAGFIATIGVLITGAAS